MLKFDEPVSFIKGATPSVRRAWKMLGIETIGDLLETIPRRYDDYSKIVAVANTRAGDVVTVRGAVVRCIKLPSFRKRIAIYRATIQDATGKISANFFNQPWVLQELTLGKEVMLSGKVTIHPKYGKSLASPLYESTDKDQITTGKLAPVYGLSGTLAQKTYRRLMHYALNNIETFEEPLEKGLRDRVQLLDRQAAFIAAHEPKDLEHAEQGRRRLAFDELLTYQLALRLTSKEVHQASAPSIAFDEKFAKRFVASLPFELTNDQKRAVWAVLQDMEKAEPMRRLLSGDVGTGKTAVAAFVASHTVRSGYSSAMLAPTDLLAKQHAETWRRMFAAHNIPMLLVTRTDRKWFFDRQEKELSHQEMDALIDQGQVALVGTHALLEARRLPKDLALAIVDEQHRFGVGQREALTINARKDGKISHFLSMTATPIPRSLALTFYGDLKVSYINQKPSGRKPVITRLCIGEGRVRAYEEIRRAIGRKEKAFVVCALIDPSDSLGVRSATEEWKRLSHGPLKGLKVGLLHGRLKAIEKDGIMAGFLGDQYDVLVATAVIEVGVDVSQATVIAIEGAERFGLAQLHQFRGRVGRSSLQSHCFLMTDHQGDSLERLRLLTHIHDGAKLAEEDLRLRGSGDLLGTSQSGHQTFVAARFKDVELMRAAREEAERILGIDDDLSEHEYWKLRVDRLRLTAHME